MYYVDVRVCIWGGRRGSDTSIFCRGFNISIIVELEIICKAVRSSLCIICGLLMPIRVVAPITYVYACFLPTHRHVYFRSLSYVV